MSQGSVRGDAGTEVGFSMALMVIAPLIPGDRDLPDSILLRARRSSSRASARWRRWHD